MSVTYTSSFLRQDQTAIPCVLLSENDRSHESFSRRLKALTRRGWPCALLMWGVRNTRPGASFAGMPRPRGDATKCDTAMSGRLHEIQQWLRVAFEVRCFGGPWEGGFPRYAWCKVGDIVYEARLVNRALGQYKGWQLEPEEWPDGIDDFEWHM